MFFRKFKKDVIWRLDKIEIDLKEIKQKDCQHKSLIFHPTDYHPQKTSKISPIESYTITCWDCKKVVENFGKSETGRHEWLRERIGYVEMKLEDMRFELKKINIKE